MRCVLCGAGLEPEATVPVQARGVDAHACPGCAAELSYSAPWRIFEEGRMPKAFEPRGERADIEGFDETPRQRERSLRPPMH